jgi:hypothetical protein
MGFAYLHLPASLRLHSMSCNFDHLNHVVLKYLLTHDWCKLDSTFSLNLIAFLIQIAVTSLILLLSDILKLKHSANFGLARLNFHLEGIDLDSPHASGMDKMNLNQGENAT